MKNVNVCNKNDTVCTDNVENVSVGINTVDNVTVWTNNESITVWTDNCGKCYCTE